MVCCKIVSCSHQGESDVSQHLEGAKHKEREHDLQRDSFHVALGQKMTQFSHLEGHLTMLSFWSHYEIRENNHAYSAVESVHSNKLTMTIKHF